MCLWQKGSFDCNFYDTNGNVAVQERGLHSKIGEKYGYFGGY